MSTDPRPFNMALAMSQNLVTKHHGHDTSHTLHVMFGFPVGMDIDVVGD